MKLPPPTIDAIATHLLGLLALNDGDGASAESPAGASVLPARASADEPIAIVGLGCRFPGGGNSPEAFWQMLHAGVDGVTEVPPDRWDIDAWAERAQQDFATGKKANPEPNAQRAIAAACHKAIASVTAANERCHAGPKPAL